MLGRADSGQAAIETAIAMPLMVFLLLGVLQLGLVAQARVVAKYAAYRAVRVGVLHNADRDAMKRAAILYLLPVLTESNGVMGHTDSAAAIIAKMTKMVGVGGKGGQASDLVTLLVCGPTREELRDSSPHSLGGAVDPKTLYGTGSTNEVDFDDPRVTDSNYPYDPKTIGGPQKAADNLRKFNRMRLRIQIQFLYRMPIPFANWVLTHIYLGIALPSVLRMSGSDPHAVKQTQFGVVAAQMKAGSYVLPINVGYAMRMQSNLFLSKKPFAPPTSNECIHFHLD